MWLYNLIVPFLRFITWFMWRRDVRGLENVPPSGGVMLCSNHYSSWDPIFMVCEIPRQVHFMGKEELYRNPVLRWILTTGEMVRVRRGMSDRHAIRDMLGYLQKGEMGGIFPEGHRSEDGQLQSFMLGAVYFASKAKVPLLPTAIRGDFKKFGSTIRLRVGKPIYLPQIEDPDRETMRLWTDQLTQAIAALQEGD